MAIVRYLIIGAGAVGGTIGGRLAQSGHEVVLVARGSHLKALRDNGLRLITPDGDVTSPIPAVDGPAALGELRPDDVLVLSVKSQDTAAAVADWAAAPVAGGGAAGDRLPLVCAQNGVANERMAARLFDAVYGLTVWLPATHLEPGVVVAHTAPMSGILTLGRYPHGSDPTVLRIGAELSQSRFDAPVVDDVMRWKYGKLLKNLANAVDALLGREAPREPVARIRERCEEEGRAVLAAAGIAFADDEERREQQGDRMNAVDIPGAPRGGGSTWQSLTKGNPAETDYLNGEIALLGRLHGVATPVNVGLQRMVARAVRDRRAPGDLTADALAEALHL
ncbi:2-dehydropantoate 2-reductase [Mycolicibacterium madagascariense]|uniref:2-dehydropantoate 2-reductase n=1 Tax=Mycolicibacterium madagascariense TaxID=212765 RepID=A0A7I7XCP6_9MYCO|nr:2-dehydropantoate 2-reductase [Mycolicibacterium madagascariense]